MQTYEGTCPYCGYTEIIMAESQDEADEEVTRRCRCGGYQKQLRRNKLQDAIWTISQEDKERNFREICGSLIGILNDIGFDVMEHRIEKAQLVIEQTTITIAENGGKVKVTRVAKTQAEEEA